jgi:hypothetical protein
MTSVAESEPPTGSPDQQRSVRKAWRFYWTFLIVATLASVGGNIAHAVLNPDHRYPALVAAAVFTAPPAVLLLVTHGAGLRARVPREPGGNYWTDMFILVLLGAGAFALSFDSLRDLALNCGVRPSMTWIWALIIDVGIAAATRELFTLARLREAASHAAAVAEHNQAARAAGAAPAQPLETTVRTDGRHAELARRYASDSAAPEIGVAGVDEIDITACDECGTAEVADEQHPARSAAARRGRGWRSEGRGRGRRDFCPACAPHSGSVTVTKRDRPMAAVPAGAGNDSEKSA